MKYLEDDRERFSWVNQNEDKTVNSLMKSMTNSLAAALQSKGKK